jgi:hypothetical protein
MKGADAKRSRPSSVTTSKARRFAPGVEEYNGRAKRVLRHLLPQSGRRAALGRRNHFSSDTFSMSKYICVGFKV